MLIVGYEGVAGLVAWSVLLPIFQFVPCSFESICTNSVIEDTAGVFVDYHTNPMLALYSVLMCLLVTILNISGVSITKYGSSAQRTTCDMLRNLFVWVFFIFVPVRYNKETGGKDTIESFTWLQLSGFLVLVFGIFMYNEFIVLPFAGFNRYTKIAIEKREKADKIERRSIAFVRGSSDNSSKGESDNTSEEPLSSKVYKEGSVGSSYSMSSAQGKK